MSISVNPILPVVATQGAVVATQGAAPELVLQPGTVVDARVLKLLSDNLVRIAIASLSIDVLSEVPLSAGQTLQLAVSEMDGGIRLAVVGQGAAAGTTSHIVTLAPDALINAAAKPSVGAAGNQLTPLERLAAKTATGGDAGAGAADQPRSKSDRRRYQECLSKIRAFSRGVAGVRICFVRRRHARSLGGADRASSNAGVDVRHSRGSSKLGRVGVFAACCGDIDACTVPVCRCGLAGCSSAAGARRGRCRCFGGEQRRPDRALRSGARRQVRGLQPAPG